MLHYAAGGMKFEMLKCALHILEVWVGSIFNLRFCNHIFHRFLSVFLGKLWKEYPRPYRWLHPGTQQIVRFRPGEESVVSCSSQSESSNSITDAQTAPMNVAIAASINNRILFFHVDSSYTQHARVNSCVCCHWFVNFQAKIVIQKSKSNLHSQNTLFWHVNLAHINEYKTWTKQKKRSTETITLLQLPQIFGKGTLICRNSLIKIH